MKKENIYLLRNDNGVVAQYPNNSEHLYMNDTTNLIDIFIANNIPNMDKMKFHLYEVENREVTVGDYSIVLGKIDKVVRCEKDATSVVFEKHGLLFDRSKFKPIIKTSDESLDLPQFNNKEIINFIK